MKFAAIDIGSNAVRLLFSAVHPNGKKITVKKADLIRVPVRLGADVFSKGIISKRNEERLVKAMIAFKNLIEIHAPENFRACATSAMREATNGEQLIKRIRKETGIKVEIIDGIEEAGLVCNNYYSQTDHQGNVLFIDVGGGSTEVSVFSGRTVKKSCSFKLGTIRILNNKDDVTEWKKLKDFCSQINEKFENITAVASGGNINKLVKFSGKKADELSLKKLKEIYAMLSSYSYEERILKFGLNPDRADVIIPACLIFISVMEAASVRKLHVPQVGLSDGIIVDLYHKSIK